jgi:hypothetical protein
MEEIESASRIGVGCSIRTQGFRALNGTTAMELVLDKGLAMRKEEAELGVRPAKLAHAQTDRKGVIQKRIATRDCWLERRAQD